MGADQPPKKNEATSLRRPRPVVSGSRAPAAHRTRRRGASQGRTGRPATRLSRPSSSFTLPEERVVASAFHAQLPASSIAAVTPRAIASLRILVSLVLNSWLHVTVGWRARDSPRFRGAHTTVRARTEQSSTRGTDSITFARHAGKRPREPLGCTEFRSRSSAHPA